MALKKDEIFHQNQQLKRGVKWTNLTDVLSVQGGNVQVDAAPGRCASLKKRRRETGIALISLSGNGQWRVPPKTDIFSTPSGGEVDEFGYFVGKTKREDLNSNIFNVGIIFARRRLCIVKLG